MTADSKRPSDKKTNAPFPDAPDTFEALEAAGKESGGMLSRFNAKFHDALQSGRGASRRRDPVVEAGGHSAVTADDLAIRRAKHVNAKRMVIPEGVIIEGSLTSGSETEIAGRIEGNVTVDGRLFLLPSALVTGNVRAASLVCEGLVEGTVQCSRDIELTKTGRFNADALAGKQFTLSGQVFGNVSTSGLLHLAPGCRVEGNVRTRSLRFDEGAILEGSCQMLTPSQRNT